MSLQCAQRSSRQMFMTLYFRRPTTNLWWHQFPSSPISQFKNTIILSLFVLFEFCISIVLILFLLCKILEGQRKSTMIFLILANWRWVKTLLKIIWVDMHKAWEISSFLRSILEAMFVEQVWKCLDSLEGRIFIVLQFFFKGIYGRR